MLLRSAVLVVLATCICFSNQANEENSAKENASFQINVNDTILEFFYNCTCIPYYLCSEANRYSFAARANILPKELYCSSTDFFCCKRVEEPDKTLTTTTSTTATVTTTTPRSEQTEQTTPPITTTQVPEVRNIFANQRVCGVAKTEIGLRILAEDTESAATIAGEVPWIVEIFQKRNVLYKLKCVGSLIHPKVVLTAAHCIVSNVNKPQSLKIIASGLERFQNVGVNPENERNVQKVIKHPQYNSGRLINDIALLILDKEYNFPGGYLNSICLPPANQKFDGKRCIAAGWGRNIDLTPVPLNKVDVPIVNSEQCQNLLRKTSLGSEFDLHSSLLCAGGEEGKDTCKGDGGGPLMCLGEEYEFVLAGMVSWGVDNKCGIVDQPGLYTNVPQFIDWIHNETMKNSITIKKINVY